VTAWFVVVGVFITLAAAGCAIAASIYHALKDFFD